MIDSSALSYTPTCKISILIAALKRENASVSGGAPHMFPYKEFPLLSDSLGLFAFEGHTGQLFPFI